MDKPNKQASNSFEDLNPTELKIIFMLRRLELFDKLEFKYSKQGELLWQLIKTDRGSYEFNDDFNN